MKIEKTNTVAQVVAENIKTAHIFKKHGIDFCCGGGITIEKACLKNDVDFTILESEMQSVDDKPGRAYDYNSWELDFLIDHIVNIHHSYVEDGLPVMYQYAEKVAKVHGHYYTEVVKVYELVQEIVKDLSYHLKKEEQILFPYIKYMLQVKKEGRSMSAPPFNTVNNPIRMMEDEHEHAGDLFKEIARLTNNYTPPKEACNTFRALYAKLEEFEQDLHQHIHLENNILHPKAITLEASING
jgi:regulator of cell morphogenesis and NO signaling